MAIWHEHDAACSDAEVLAFSDKSDCLLFARENGGTHVWHAASNNVRMYLLDNSVGRAVTEKCLLLRTDPKCSLFWTLANIGRGQASRCYRWCMGG